MRGFALGAHRQRLAIGRVLPRGGVKINWRHPLTKGLVGCWLPGISVGINLGPGGGAALVKGSGTGGAYSSTAEGPGWQTTLDTDGLKGVSPPAFKNWNVDGFTVYWRGRLNANSAGSGTILAGMEYNNPESSPYVVACVSVAGTNSLQVAWNSGGTLNAPSVVGYSAGHQSVAGTFRAGGSGKLFNNGRKIQTNTFGASQPNTSSTTTTSICAGTYTGSRACSAVSCLVVFWNRELSESEMALLDSNPYAIFAPVMQQTLVATTAAGRKRSFAVIP